MVTDTLPARFRRAASAQPLLDAGTERRLARRWRRHGDTAARDRLIAAHLRLVIKIATDLRWSGYDLADLVQEGNVGLLLAAERFDPERGVRFASYASWWIRACVLKHVTDNWRLVRVGTTAMQRKLLTRARPADAPAELEQHITRPELSIDATRPDGARVVEEPAAPAASRPDVIVEELDHRRAVARAAADLEDELTPRERTIFRSRWRTEAPRTLEQMGRRFGVSRERVRQLEARTLARLRVLLEVRQVA